MNRSPQGCPYSNMPLPHILSGNLCVIVYVKGYLLLLLNEVLCFCLCVLHLPSPMTMKTSGFPSTPSRRLNEAIPFSRAKEEWETGLRQSKVYSEISYWEIKGYKSLFKFWASWKMSLQIFLNFKRKKKYSVHAELGRGPSSWKQVFIYLN